jgi:hypothetical protein
MAGTRVHMQCAAITNGCMAWLVFPLPPGCPPVLDEVLDDTRVLDLLRMNGWHESYGRWVCPAHPVTVPA